MKVDGIGWGMWHAWEINVYIVWFERLRERDYLGNLCVDRQIILKLIWKKYGELWVGSVLSGLDTSGTRGSGSKHKTFSVSVLYTCEQFALCSSRITPCEIAFCVHWLGHSCPGYEHGRPSFCRQSRGHACIAIYCTKLTQLIWCHVQITVNIVTFHLFCVCVHVEVCTCSVVCSEMKQSCSILLQFIANVLHILQTVNTHQCHLLNSWTD